MRRRVPGETWRDWARRNEPELVLLAIFGIPFLVVALLRALL